MKKNKNTSEKLNTERITVLDSLKGIAILGVVLVHSGATELPGFFGQISAFGARGVQMFLIISAMLIFNSLDSFENSEKKIKLKNWYFNRFLRLIPIYYISLIVQFFINGFTPNYWTGTHPINIFTYILNVLFLHGLSPWSINAINVGWYIGTLALFIILAPFIHKKVNNLSKSIIFFAVTWVIALLVSMVIPRLYIGVDDYIWSTYWTNFSLISELPILAIGIILYYLIYKKDIIITKGVTTTLTFCIILILIERYISSSTLVTFSIIFGALIFIQIKNSNFIIDNKFFATLGKYSYGIYLFHYPIINKLTDIYSNYCSNSYLLITTVICSTIILSTFISYILTRFIEKPIVKKFKKAKI